MLDIAEAERFFFRAMVAGYAADAPKMRVPQLPGYKLYTHSEGPYTLTDCYWTTVHASSSAGETLIVYEGQPVWCMRYEGAYEKAVTPFLKQVLAQAYAACRFYSGRGEHRATGEVEINGKRLRIEYLNSEDPGNARNRLCTFTQFRGSEEIREVESKRVCGFHDYSGGWIAKLSNGRSWIPNR